MRTFAPLAVLLTVSVSLPAQERVPTFPAQVHVVNLDISVTDDKTHRFVQDLTAEDFVIKEGGDDQPQHIVSFQRQERPLDLTILVDISGSMDRVLEQTRLAAIELAKTMRPQDQVQALFFATHTRVICPFTSDPKALETALAAIRPDTEATRLRRVIDERLEQALQRAADTIQRKNPGLSDEEADDIARAVIMTLADMPVETGSSLKDTATAAREVFEEATRRTSVVLRQKIPGLAGKQAGALAHTVVFAVASIPTESDATHMQRAVYEQLEELRKHADDQDRRKVLIILTDGIDNDPLANDDWLLAKAHHSNTAAYTILIQPLMGYTGFAAEELAQHALWLLNTLADQTGGRLVILKLSYQTEPGKPAPLGHEVKDAFARIGLELRTQYRVGYEPRLRSPGGTFRSVSVALPLRSGLTVRHRSGYLVPVGP